MMKRILLVAQREFIATVSTKAFIIGLLIMPIMFAVLAVVFPRLLNPRNFKTRGEVAVIDPSGRLPATARAFRDDGVRRLVITADSAGAQPPAGIERVALPAVQGRLDPCDILKSLAARGLRRILIEGGPATVARFLEARCLDRLHVVVAPIILGGGRSSLDLAPITRCEEALRPHTFTHVLGNEVLFDCDLSAQRRPIGSAKKSM